MTHSFRGKNNPMYGKHHSAESNLKNRLAHLGKHHTEEAKRKMKGRIPWSKGKKLPPLSYDTKRKLSEALSGEKNPMFNKKHTINSRKLMSMNNARYNLGRKFSDETKKKMSENHMVVINEKNPNWKGDEAGYNALHDWVRRHKPKPELCEICKKKEPYDLANISDEYKRDINDYQWICRACHLKKHRNDESNEDARNKRKRRLYSHR